MTISRRGFLKSMLAMAAAPAICKAENLMKIYVPPQEIILPSQEILEVADLTFGTGDFTIEAWMNKDQWHHVCQTYNAGIKREYIDGVQVPIGTQERLMGGVKLVGTDKDRENNLVIMVPNANGNQFDGLMSDLRIRNDARIGYSVLSDVRATNGVVRNPKHEFERFRGDFNAEHGRFPKVGYAINKQEPKVSKLLDRLMQKEDIHLLTVDGKKLV